MPPPKRASSPAPGSESAPAKDYRFMVLMLAAPQLAAFSLNFTSVEYFALGVFALICIAQVSRGSLLKGLLSGAVGMEG